CAGDRRRPSRQQPDRPGAGPVIAAPSTARPRRRAWPAGQAARTDAARFSPALLLLLAEIEQVRCFGPLHALLPVFLPDLRPGPAIHVGYLVLDDATGCHGRCRPLQWVDGLDAFDERHGIDLRINEVATLVHALDDADGINQRLRVIKNGFVADAGEPTLGVPQRRVDLDRLHLPGMLEGGVRRPGLDIGGPGDE